MRLTEYDIVEPSMREVILRKLSTKVGGLCLLRIYAIAADLCHAAGAPTLACYTCRSMAAALANTANHARTSACTSELAAAVSFEVACALTSAACATCWMPMQPPHFLQAAWSRRDSIASAPAWLTTLSAMSDAPAMGVVSKGDPPTAWRMSVRP